MILPRDLASPGACHSWLQLSWSPEQRQAAASLLRLLPPLLGAPGLARAQRADLLAEASVALGLADGSGSGAAGNS